MNPRPLIASKAHTAILASILVAMAIAGGYAQHAGSIQRALPTGHQMLRLYASVLLVEWASVFYVWKGIRRRNVVRLRELVGGRWQRPADIVADVALGALLWTAWVGIESAFSSSNAASGLLPRSALEAFVWIFVAFSAGVCEELVFRGYFQKQFLAMTGSVAAAIALQAFVFGIGHFYEGPWTVVKIILYGALFGMLAAWRRSLPSGHDRAYLVGPFRRGDLQGLTEGLEMILHDLAEHTPRRRLFMARLPITAARGSTRTGCGWCPAVEDARSATDSPAGPHR